MERLHRAASRAITGCLSSFPMPLLLSEASLPPLRVTLTHFTYLFYERALRLPTFFPISGLARLGVKPRLCRSSWRAFASTHPLTLPSTFLREALLACSPWPFWNLLSFTVESILSSPCSRSDSNSLSPRCGSRSPWFSPTSQSFAVDWLLCSFSFWQGRLRRSCQLLSLWYYGHSFHFSRPSMFKLFRWSLRHSARNLLVSAAPTSLPRLFSSPSIRLSFCPHHPVFSLISLADLAETIFSLLRFYQTTMGSRTLVSPGEPRGWWAGQRGALLVPSAISCSLSPHISRIHTSLFSDYRHTVSSEFFDTQLPTISTEELVLPRHARCVLSRLRCNGHSLLLSSYLFRIGRIENPSCSACGHSSQDTSHLILHCPVVDSLRRSLFGDSLSLYNL